MGVSHLRAQRDLYRVRELLHAREDRRPALGTELDLLCSIVPDLLVRLRIQDTAQSRVDPLMLPLPSAVGTTCMHAWAIGSTARSPSGRARSMHTRPCAAGDGAFEKVRHTRTKGVPSNVASPP